MRSVGAHQQPMGRTVPAMATKIAAASVVPYCMFQGNRMMLPPSRLRRRVKYGWVPIYMPIQQLHTQQSSFGPEEVKVLVGAFEEALRELRLMDREDPATLWVAKRIIELAQGGERDPIRLREGAVKAI